MAMTSHEAGHDVEMIDADRPQDDADRRGTRITRHFEAYVLDAVRTAIHPRDTRPGTFVCAAPAGPGDSTKHEPKVSSNIYRHLNGALLCSCFGRLLAERTPGVDDLIEAKYEKDLWAHLENLEKRLQQRTYRPLSCLRRELSGADGKTRAPGIAVLEDKLVELGLAAVLQRVYGDVGDFSYGFRPAVAGQGLPKELYHRGRTQRMPWRIDVDIEEGCLENLDHELLLRMLGRRVNDPDVFWLIRRFLRAGVLVVDEDLDPQRRLPQGTGIAPLLARIYLHYVLDDWLAKLVVEHVRGEAYLLRHQNDLVAWFEYRDDALRFDRAIRLRLARFDLAARPNKETRPVDLGRVARRGPTSFLCNNEPALATDLVKADERIAGCFGPASPSSPGSEMRTDEEDAQKTGQKYTAAKYRNLDALLNYVESDSGQGAVKVVIMNFND